jgi:hypothetical protein
MRAMTAPRSDWMEFPMSIKTRIAALALATLAVTGGIASSTTQAQASPKWVGPALFGAAVVGTAIAASNHGYYDGYRRCGWVRQFDVFGRYVGRIRTCNF